MKRAAPVSSAFTLVEVLLSTVILALIVTIAASMIGVTHDAWNRTQKMVSQFREARVGFEAMSHRLSQARLNAYWDYEYRDRLPVRYRRQSELHFLTGPAADLLGDAEVHPGHAVFFQAPLGMTGDLRYKGLGRLLNAWGYFIEFGSDEAWRPSIVRNDDRVLPRYRFRLMEFRQPAEDLAIYASGNPGDRKWIREHLAPDNVRIVAENVIGLLITPLEPGDDPEQIAPAYGFDSRVTRLVDDGSGPREMVHDLPPVVRLTLVAIDETTAVRLQEDRSEPPAVLRFENEVPFTDARSYVDDIEKLRAYFSERHIEIRIFTAAVPIRSAN